MLDSTDIQRNIPLRDKNWFATGGAAHYYAAPTDAQAFQRAIKFAHSKELPITLLGHGANCLIDDNGIQGLVLHPALQNITIEGSTVTAGAGVSTQTLIDFCLTHNLIGLEEFSGIPGTVGGSVFINLHYFEFFLSDFLASAHVIHQHTGEIIKVDNAWFNFGYNTSTLHNAPYYLLDATFALQPTDDLGSSYARGRAKEIIRHRTARYPNKNTCGSFFRNFLPEEVTLDINGKKMVHVAYYLDKLGVKGTLQIGGAAVSYQHANMIINRGDATSQDIVTLARMMQGMVYEQFDIIPQPECRLLGFSEYPLMR